ncbi:Prolipoprotein diacylglyceryl transferase [Moorella glycerini]|uniref:Phosphatidylglycerol--prolipoprotein diacylglyceryl transferase n=1 Tax=Neomoorella stamsii TaxID=1266720 RepID=A0A9X7P4N9_9FIRM|nr:MULTISPECIES: prolipoprotein diacylglyceryl transferase [Moorella]PRR68888.1 Prolipoprotein diacylglyceryl transferase [Moorella stamsii]CEP67509.1 Prolipoprotein diacylglyceryl transferase [Moorella glycerini]
MRRVLFYLGPLPVNTFGFMIALGILAAIFIILREARRKGLNEDKVLDFTLWALILGIFGARVGYVVVAGPAYFWQNPLQFFHLQDGGLSIHGAIIGGILAGLIFTRRYRLPFWRLADTVAPGLALGIAIGRVGCDVFGRPMANAWPWGVMVNGQLLHPAQVYEFILDYLLFFYLWRRRKNVAYDGQLFIRFIILYATIRGIVEFVRYNPPVWGPFSVAHVASLAFIIVAALAGIILKLRPGPRANSGAPGAATTAELRGVGATIEDRLTGQLLVLVLLLGLSLAAFYSLGP